MKNLIFRELLMISHNERRARRIKFHPKVTIIKGGNDTGKSSVIKSIFAALGAQSAKIHPTWKTADVFLFLEFEISGTVYKIFRMRGNFALFSSDNRLISVYKRVTSELGPKIAEMFNFKLVLVDREQKEVTPPPVYLFVPFYIDQENGWSRSWSSFDRLAQLPKWRKDVTYYHTGIRPNEYYLLRAKCRVLESKKSEPTGHERLLLKFKERFGKDILNNDVSLDISVFQREISELMKQCETLKVKEEKFREKLFELESERMRLEAQSRIVSHAQKELDADYLYTTTLPNEEAICCPMCGQGYENSFAGRFSIANDHQKCVTLLHDIIVKLDDINKNIKSHKTSVHEAKKELDEIQNIMNRKSGDVTLLSLLKAMSGEYISSQIADNLTEVRTEISDIDSDIKTAQEELKKLQDKDRVAEIIDFYRNKMDGYLYNLSVTNLSRKSYSKIECEIKETGSDLPRAILAYYFAIVATIKKHGTSVMCPFVIDSPNQQDQDKMNYGSILNFIKDYKPSENQTIMALVDDFGVDFGGDVIEMTEKNHALSDSEYDEVFAYLKPFEVMAMTSLHG